MANGRNRECLNVFYEYVVFYSYAEKEIPIIVGYMIGGLVEKLVICPNIAQCMKMNRISVNVE